MAKLREITAIEIHKLLLSSHNAIFVANVHEALKNCAEAKMGMYAVALGWFGRELPATIARTIKNTYDIEYLHERNLLSKDGNYIELSVLADALPEEMVMSYFHFDMEEKARNYGVNLDHVRNILRKYVIKVEANGSFSGRVFLEKFNFLEKL